MLLGFIALCLFFWPAYDLHPWAHPSPLAQVFWALLLAAACLGLFALKGALFGVQSKLTFTNEDVRVEMFHLLRLSQKVFAFDSLSRMETRPDSKSAAGFRIEVQFADGTTFLSRSFSTNEDAEQELRRISDWMAARG